MFRHEVLDRYISHVEENSKVRNLGNQANEFCRICVRNPSAREHSPRLDYANDAGDMCG